ncbi:LOW QUALITY PROTEIN: hypothetical protein MAR_018322, partial [Mya arenaria]
MVGRTTNAECPVLDGLFKLLESTGSYTGDLLDKALLQFCFIDVIQWCSVPLISVNGRHSALFTCDNMFCEFNMTEELDEVCQLWNCHRIRPVRNNISPRDRSVTMYTCPELYGAQDYLCAVPRANVDSCLE